jgi:alpha-glucosidase
MKKQILNGLAVGLACAVCTMADSYNVISPDGALQATLNIETNLSYSVQLSGNAVLLPSRLSMELADGQVLGETPELLSVERHTVSNVLQPVVHTKSSEIAENYQEAVFTFSDDYQVALRVYNDGIAYRFITALPGEITVCSEQVEYRFNGNPAVYWPAETNGFISHTESFFLETNLTDIAANSLGSLPTMVQVADDPKVVITENDLEDYPGLWLNGTGGSCLNGIHPKVVMDFHIIKDRKSVIDKRADYIAKTSGSRAFPWRTLIVGDDADLLQSELGYLLGRPCQIEDTSWIKPGKAAWDWFNACNLFGVDFRAGINTETYKYYIDFAATNGLEYIILDEGWTSVTNCLEVNPDIDIHELVRYGNERNVGLIVWMIWKPLDDHLDEVLSTYRQWGVKGIKVDFFMRDDQWMVNCINRIVEKAAEYQLLVNLHGCYKPTGLRRTYPNLITREAVRGLENNKWSDFITPEHDLTIPFIRMAVGPMDYTPGAMRNKQAIRNGKKNHSIVFYRPESQGTRCRQLAMYVIYESPLQMLADSPSYYIREQECTDMIASIPTVWDDTKILHAELGKCLVLARRNGTEWYLGAMTDWDSRTLDISLSFLPEGQCRAVIYQDGINADHYAEDYKRIEKTVSCSDFLKIKFAAGGGYAARITSSVEGSGNE